MLRRDRRCCGESCGGFLRRALVQRCGTVHCLEGDERLDSGAGMSRCVVNSGWSQHDRNRISKLEPFYDCTAEERMHLIRHDGVASDLDDPKDRFSS
jgi:hypothetical protein